MILFQISQICHFPWIFSWVCCCYSDLPLSKLGFQHPDLREVLTLRPCLPVIIFILSFTLEWDWVRNSTSTLTFHSEDIMWIPSDLLRSCKPTSHSFVGQVSSFSRYCKFLLLSLVLCNFINKKPVMVNFMGPSDGAPVSSGSQRWPQMCLWGYFGMRVTLSW